MMTCWQRFPTNFTKSLWAIAENIDLSLLEPHAVHFNNQHSHAKYLIIYARLIQSMFYHIMLLRVGATGLLRFVVFGV